MCLTVTSRVPERIKFKRGRAICYKFMTRRGNRLESPYQGTAYTLGVNKAVGHCSDCGTIYDGAIHVYTSKKYALSAAESNEVVIPVVCLKEDFIAEGDSKDAAFTKVFVRTADYRKALKSTSKYAVVGR